MKELKFCHSENLVTLLSALLFLSTSNLIEIDLWDKNMMPHLNLYSTGSCPKENISDKEGMNELTWGDDLRVCSSIYVLSALVSWLSFSDLPRCNVEG